MLFADRSGRSLDPRLLRSRLDSGAPPLFATVIMMCALGLPACTDRDGAGAEGDGNTGAAVRDKADDPATPPVGRRDRPSADSTANRARVADQLAAEATATPPDAAARSGQAATDTVPGGFHLDDAEVEYEVPRRAAAPRKGRPIEIILRSTPAGAVAAVDGVTIGATPALWEGVADTSPREFTFVLPGYSIARYRFIPTQGGTVHGTLERLKTDLDAGPPPAEAEPLPAPR